MPTTLTTHAPEKGSYVIAIAFTDEDKTPVVPNNIVWSLVQSDETVVNNRTDVVVTPAASIQILLKDADLAILNGAKYEKRYVIIEYDYDSTLGAGIPEKEEVEFTIVNLKKVT